VFKNYFKTTISPIQFGDASGNTTDGENMVLKINMNHICDVN